MHACFTIIGAIKDIEMIAANNSIRDLRRYTGMRPTESANGKKKSSASSGSLKLAPTEPRRKFVLCVGNKGYPAALELRKVYELLPDRAAGKHGMLRVIDESGEDYLYPADFFAPIAISGALAEKLAKSA